MYYGEFENRELVLALALALVLALVFSFPFRNFILHVCPREQEPEKLDLWFHKLSRDEK